MFGVERSKQHTSVRTCNSTHSLKVFIFKCHHQWDSALCDRGVKWFIFLVSSQLLSSHSSFSEEDQRQRNAGIVLGEGTNHWPQQTMHTAELVGISLEGTVEHVCSTWLGSVDGGKRTLEQLELLYTAQAYRGLENASRDRRTKCTLECLAQLKMGWNSQQMSTYFLSYFR